MLLSDEHACPLSQRIPEIGKESSNAITSYIYSMLSGNPNLDTQLVTKASVAVASRIALH